MWLGLYIVVSSLLFIGHFGEFIFDDRSETLAACFWLLKIISFFAISIVTAIFGIILIINN
jgi:hypothetical protein